MSSFKFEVNWTLNGVDMTSQTYTHFINAPVQIPHMGPYKMCINLKDDMINIICKELFVAMAAKMPEVILTIYGLFRGQ